MGVEFYIINKENKTFYDLGKGCWEALIREPDALTDLEYLSLFIFENVFHLEATYSDEDDGWEKYCSEMAAEIFEMAKCRNLKNIKIIDDCGDETPVLRALNYRCVGSRYRDPNEPEYYVNFQNRHLLNPEKYRIYQKVFTDPDLQDLVTEYSTVV